MLCYQDRTFCPYYSDCKHGYKCQSALTPEVRKAAIEWWGSDDAPIAEWTERPRCHEGMNGKN